MPYAIKIISWRVPSISWSTKKISWPFHMKIRSRNWNISILSLKKLWLKIIRKKIKARTKWFKHSKPSATILLKKMNSLRNRYICLHSNTGLLPISSNSTIIVKDLPILLHNSKNHRIWRISKKWLTLVRRRRLISSKAKFLSYRNRTMIWSSWIWGWRRRKRRRSLLSENKLRSITTLYFDSKTRL